MEIGSVRLVLERRHRWSSIAAIFLAVAVTGTSCTSSGTSTVGRNEASVDVSSAKGASVSAGPADISLDPNTVTGVGKLSLVLGSGPVASAGPVERVGDAFQVSLAGAALTGTAQIRVTLNPAAFPASTVPVIVWQDGHGGWQWLPTSVSADRRTATAETTHFSWGFLGRVDVNAWAKDAANTVSGVLTGRSNVAQPSCGDENALRDSGVKVVSDGGDSVKWCAGRDGGRDVVKVSNNRRTFSQFTYPASWTLTDGGGGGFSFDALNRSVAGAFGELVTPPGTKVRIVDGGDTLTFALPADGSGVVLVESTFIAWAMSALEFGISEYAAAAAYVGGDVATAASGGWKLFLARLIGASPLDSFTEAVRSCGSGFSSHLTGIPASSSTTLSALAPEITKFLWECIPALMKADVESTGANMFLAGIALSLVGTVVSLVLTAVNLLTTSIREIWDSLASFGGKSNPIYRIAVFRPAPDFGPFVGDWWHHGAALHVNGDGTFRSDSRSYDPCPGTAGYDPRYASPSSGRPCEDPFPSMSIHSFGRLTTVSGSVAIGEYLSSNYQPPGWKPGPAKFEWFPSYDTLLEYGTDGSVLSWCGPKAPSVPADQRFECGA